MIVVGQYDYATAATRATQLTYHGLQGHLATLTSLAEYRFLFWTLNARQVWLAMTDLASEGTWIHAAGPEIGTPVTWSSGYWAPGEPNGNTDENCGLLWYHGLADYPCNRAF